MICICCEQEINPDKGEFLQGWLTNGEPVRFEHTGHISQYERYTDGPDHFCASMGFPEHYYTKERFYWPGGIG